MKTCSRCRETKPFYEFFARSGEPGKFRSHCKVCLKGYEDRNREHIRVYKREWARAHPESAVAKYERTSATVKAQAVARQRASRAAHPEIWRARSRANSALQRALKRALKSGQLDRPDTCEGCGQAGVVIEAAHSDYTRPLDVRWLCRRCHRQWDKAEPKLMREA